MTSRRRHWFHRRKEGATTRGWHQWRERGALAEVLPVGSVLRREYPRGSGIIHVVRVRCPRGIPLSSGKKFYEYHGLKHRSLTAVVKTITGTNKRWSGPQFFGLKTAVPVKIEGKWRPEDRERTPIVLTNPREGGK